MASASSHNLLSGYVVRAPIKGLVCHQQPFVSSLFPLSTSVFEPCHPTFQVSP